MITKGYGAYPAFVASRSSRLFHGVLPLTGINRGYGPSEEHPVYHTMDGRRIVGPRPTWDDYRRAYAELVELHRKALGG